MNQKIKRKFAADAESLPNRRNGKSDAMRRV
jgi:hypothetical protein